MTLTHLAVAVLFTVTVVAGVSVTLTNCTDRAFCASGCESVQLPADVCLPLSNGGSQVISCNPLVSVCGDLSYFSDAGCTNLQFTDGFVCDRCNRDHSGNYSLINCLRKNGIESLGLNHCGASCGACNNFFNLTAGACIAVGSGSQLSRFVTGRRQIASEFSGQLYAKYTGSTTCTGIVLNQWLNGNSQCQFAPTQTPELPENSCIDGVRFSCQF